MADKSDNKAQQQNNPGQQAPSAPRIPNQPDPALVSQTTKGLRPAVTVPTKIPQTVDRNLVSTKTANEQLIKKEK